MGGPGSGSYRYRVKTLVENCFSFALSPIKEHLKRVDAGEGTFSGRIFLTRGDMRDGEMRILVSKLDECLTVRLSYKITNRWKEENLDIEFPIRIQHTYPHIGGKRYWLTCPISGCGRRVGKLYLPPRGKYFGCRHCYDLTYTSSRESHKWDDPFPFRALQRTLDKLLRKGH